jgi:SAM-dependent methyltransferase
MSALVTKLKRAVPKPIRLAFREGREHLRKRLIFSRFAPLVPPERLMHDGPPTYSDFKQNAEEFLQLYIDLCDLKRNERILDIGCGIGRKTVLLTDYLNDHGSYEGLDIVLSGIEWCSRKITKKISELQVYAC